MKNILIVIILIFIFSSFSLLPIININSGKSIEINKSSSVTSINRNLDTEYWAILIGVDCTWNTDSVFRLPFDENVKCMYDTLLFSDHWKTDHIKVLINENATLINIIKAFYWLDKMEDGDDICLIYYSGHGNYLSWLNRNGVEILIDLPPFDEQDKCDEYITTYWSSKNPFSIITDDLFNFLLNKLDSRGVAVLFDSCYSGGMNDTRSKTYGYSRSSHLSDDASSWSRGFVEDFSKDGRVILMASRENESAYGLGWKLFGSFIAEGLQGFADNNSDDIISIEEAFDYAAPKYKDFIDDKCTPIMDDLYFGDLSITDVELPPSLPVVSTDNEIVGQPGSIFVFNATSTDPEGNQIRYGWNWRNDSVIRKNLWGYNVEEWSILYNSGDVCIMSHSWDKPGVYTVRVKAQDEYGAELIPEFDYSGLWTYPLFILIRDDDEIVDQYQIACDSSTTISRIYAQSFTPTTSTLSKLKLKLRILKDIDEYIEYYEHFPLNVSIRDNLTGEDLEQISLKLYIDFINLPREYSLWVEFDLYDLSLNPNDNYFIVVSCDSEEIIYGWGHTYYNSYDQGLSYYKSSEGWIPDFNSDFCFITYE